MSGVVAQAPAEATGERGHGTSRKRVYVLLLLTMIYGLSLIDRIAVGIVQEPIKHEFGLTDLQLGILGGPAFAILYALLGLPLARIAERRSRVALISLALALWSIMTGLCGTAHSYLTLVLARLGVSVGEAGCAPASQAVITDYFPPAERTIALAVFALGTPAASVVAGFAGGWLAQEVGWRLMFVTLGLAGVGLAVVLKASVGEPPRTGLPAGRGPSIRETFTALRGIPSFWFFTLGAASSCFVGYGVGQYIVSFLMRAHHLSLVEASRLNGLIFGLSAGIGTFLCGYISNRFERRWPRAFLWMPAMGMMVAAPLYAIGYLSNSLPAAVAALMFGAMTNYFYVGTMYSAINKLAPPGTRITATATLILAMNILGYGLGPPTVGFISDTLQANALTGLGLAAVRCGVEGAAAVQAACAAASADGLRTAIVTCVAGYLVAGLMFVIAAMCLSRDARRRASPD